MTDNHLLLYRLAELMLKHEQHILPVDLLFDDEQIGDFVKSIQIDSPYQQMLIEGVLNESVRDEELYVCFTIEGYFHYVLSEVIADLVSSEDPKEVLTLVINSKLNGAKSGLEEYLNKCAMYNNESAIFSFIKFFPEHALISIKSFALMLTINDKDYVLKRLFQNPANSNIELLVAILNFLYLNNPIANIELQKELLNYSFLSENESSKKIYIDALNNTDIRSIDINNVLEITSEDAILEFNINISKMDLFRKLNKYNYIDIIINKNINLMHKLKLENIRNEVITFYDRMSVYYAEIGKYLLALEASKNALKYSDEDDNDHGVLLNNIALRYMELGMFNEAYLHLDMSLSIDLKKYGKYSRNVASRYGNIGFFNLEKSNYTVAIEYLRKAIEIDRSILGENDEIIATRLINLAEALRNIHKIDEALHCICKARDIDLRNYGPFHPMMAYTYNLEASIYEEIGNSDLFIASINKSIEINRLFQNGINDKLNRDLNKLGVHFAKLGKYEEAITALLQADAVEEKLFANSPELRIITWLNICKVYMKAGNKEKLNLFLNFILGLPEDVKEEYSIYINDLIHVN